jgi:6-phosphogluconolactonase
MGGRPKLNIFANRDALSAALAAYVGRLAGMTSAAKGRFCVALSGGSLMDIISPHLGSNPLRDTVDWSSWQVFWADERWVPWRSPESNHGLAQRQLFNRVSIPEEQVHATDDSLSPVETAHAYESTLAAVFQAEADQLPRFDLVLLGIGEDGHTASLFPGHPALQETRRWVVPVFDAPKPPPIRITMTLPVINHSRHVVFVAAGSGKAKIVSTVLNDKVQQPGLPARRVNPSDGELQWFIDRAASVAEC